ncbi:hypothetical protein C8Q74DRAFT_1450815 [Fomes fomentarius]|nr:hypothetical protein C8Q74DRAFT_1450815 [Fomes fomentarius]
MQLTFSPPLGHTTTLRIPPIPRALASNNASAGQAIRFKATFDSRVSLLKAETDGVKVELWTDLPVHGRARGEWGAVQFTQSDLDSGSQESLSSSSSTLFLTGADAAVRKENALHLSLYTSLQDHIGSHFQFTYRLVYPSGRVIWLGTHDNNGVFTVERGLPGIHLSEIWHVRKDGKYHLAAAVDGDLIHIEEPDQWTIWTWKSSSLAVQSDRTAALVRAVVLVPRASLRDGATPVPVVLAAKGSSSLRLTPDGTVSQASHSTDTEQAVLGPLEYSLDLLVEVASVYNGIVQADDSSITISSHPSEGIFPVQLFVLPVVAVGSRSIHAPDLQSVIAPPPSGELLLFSPDTRRVNVLKPSSPVGTLRDHVGSSGGEVLVSPIHVVDDNGNVWQVALFARHRDASLRIESASVKQHLPTPPPSPPAPVASVPNSEARQRSAQTEIGRQANESPSPPARSMQPHLPSNRSALSLALTRNLPVRLLRAYLHTLFNLIFWFWNVFLRALVVRLVGEGIPRRISSLFGLALSMTARSRSPTRREDRLRQERRMPGSSPSRRNGIQATPVETSENAQMAASTVSSYNLHAPRAQRPSPAPDEQEASSFTPSRLVFSAELTQGHAAPFIICRGSGLIKARATLNGKVLHTPSTLPAKDDAHTVLEFLDLSLEGRLEVSWDL